MKKDVAIEVRNVSKYFLLPHQKASSIKSVFLNPFVRYEKEKQKALHDISFEIKKGEFFGIVGRNGSGKSTLLKCMAGVYQADHGEIKTNGSVIPFIELGVGFNPELSGRDNVYLNGALLGFDRHQIDEMYEEIVEFAELEEFMDQKLKNYSSGMQVRLAFSIAIRARGDILLLDEVLAVGDEAFQKKCFQYFRELKESGRTVVLVSHSMDSIKQFCSRAMLIERGKIKHIGTPEEVANLYTLDNLNSDKRPTEKRDKNNLSNQVKILDVKPLSELSLKKGQKLKFEVSYQLNEKLDIDLGIGIVYKNVSIIEQNTEGLQLPNRPGVLHKIRYSILLNDLCTNSYRVDVAMFTRSDFSPIGFNTDAFSFNFEHPDVGGGVMKMAGEWKIDAI